LAVAGLFDARALRPSEGERDPGVCGV